MIRSTFFISLILIAWSTSHAQQVDSIFFHLYTDSLKKGTYNYINVDGKFDNGKWTPLTSKHIAFTASAGKFEGNSLVIEKDFAGDSIIVTAILRTDNTIRRTIAIPIKKKADDEKLKTSEEILQEIKQPKRKKSISIEPSSTLPQSCCQDI